ncbi:MAG: hypothetical protein R2822_21610 [Spirosomataceae bacterium]
MKSAFYSVLLLWVGTLLFFACQDKPDEIPLLVRRLEKEIFAAQAPEDLATILQQNPYLKPYFGLLFRCT